jgi:hypothetical protein
MFAALFTPWILKAGDWKTDLESKLTSIYTLSKVSKLSGAVSSPGTIVVVKVDNLTGSDQTAAPNKVVDGKASAPSGLSAAFNKHIFRKNDRLYVTDLNVSDNNIKMVFLAVDASNESVEGTSGQVRYRCIIQFEYPKNYLQAADIAKIKSDLAAIVPTEDQANAVQTKTIGLGQTMAEVEAILGKPENIINLGTKVTYVYKNMKVIFVDGKVVDVQ